MNQQTIVADSIPAPEPTDSKVAPAVKTLPIDEVKRLIRKVSEDHEGLFRRLAN